MKSSLLLLLCLGAGACDSPATKIGFACKKDGDCNVAGQTCVLSICTHGCAGQFGAQGCPIGYNCTSGGSATAPLTCNKIPFAVDPMTGDAVLFGVSCVAGDATCMGTSDTNGAPQCRKGENPIMPGTALAPDPGAYCTGSCTSDADCPYFMFCNTDFDMVQKCMFRKQCGPCTYNDNCNKGDATSSSYACVATTDGKDHYCTHTCAVQNDCPGAAQSISYLACRGGNDAQGNAGSFCIHKRGMCVGTGEICDPCRTKADCAKSGTSCISNDQTGEQMCSKACANDAACAGPNNATCDDTNIPSAANPSGNSIGICTGDDSAHNNPGLFTCNL